jgi:hypothetical protein
MLSEFSFRLRLKCSHLLLSLLLLNICVRLWKCLTASTFWIPLPTCRACSSIATYCSLGNSSSLALLDFREHNNHNILTPLRRANTTAGISKHESTF